MPSASENVCDRGRPEVTGRLQSRRFFTPCRTLFRRSCFGPSGQHIWVFQERTRFCRHQPSKLSCRMNSPSGLLMLFCRAMTSTRLKGCSTIGWLRAPGPAQRPARGEPDTLSRCCRNGKGGYTTSDRCSGGMLIRAETRFAFILPCGC